MQASLRAGDLAMDRAARRVDGGRPDARAVAQGVRPARIPAHPQGRGGDPHRISEHVWDDSFDSLGNVIDVTVHRLRKKIDGERPAAAAADPQGGRLRPQEPAGLSRAGIPALPRLLQASPSAAAGSPLALLAPRDRARSTRLLLLAPRRARAADRAGRRADPRHRRHPPGLATSHLWLEERLSGDPVNRVLIYGNLERALALIGGLLGGGRACPQPRDRAPPCADDVAGCRAFAGQPWNAPRTASASARAPTSTARPTSSSTASRGRPRKLGPRSRGACARRRATRGPPSPPLLTGWLSTVGASAVGLWSRERRRKLAEAALQTERGAAAPGAEDGGGRPAGGGPGPRHQQLRHRHHQPVRAGPARRRRPRPGCSPTDGPRDRHGAERSPRLIRRLLAFSRRQPIQPRGRAAQRGRAEGLRNDAARLIGEDVELAPCSPADLWNVKIDPSQVEQIVVNLVVNAREASRGRQPDHDRDRQCALDEALEGGGAAGDYVLLAVSDTGTGIPPELATGSSSRSSPPRRRAPASGWGSPPSTAS